MEYLVSIDTEGGERSINMVKTPLLVALKEAMLKAPENKADCWLISNGFSTQRNRYTREEWNFDAIETILIDCDNNKDNPDPTLLEQFKNDYSEYDYILWESASSTIECPKFRAILLLDERIEWVNEPVKFTKNAIKHLFAKYTDDNASWYFTPTQAKVSTVHRHLGRPYPSRKILEVVQALKLNHQIMMMDMEVRQNKANERGWNNAERARRDYHELPLVVEYQSSMKGNRNSSGYKAACSMFARGYTESEVKTMLEEGPLNKNEISTVFCSAKRLKTNHTF